MPSTTPRTLAIATLTVACLAPAAHAQFAITSFTIDAGGGTSSGGQFALTGTIGQPDAGMPLAGGNFTLAGGFWSGNSFTCPPDFNHSGALTVQDIFDFLGAWFAGTAAADYNASGTITVQDIFDFLAAWFAGC